MITIKAGGSEIDVIKDLTTEVEQSLLPFGVTRITARNPAFSTFMVEYGKLLVDKVASGEFDALAPEVASYHYVKYCLAAGITIEVTRG
ncbi:hypothetical protein VspSw1_86 [Vibrio phage VspSw_1]|uniref:Uncharacterized protein n=1 Tax=Vibrio phage VspSw_1 TaxID=2484249 RepID=A0A411BKQ1_9CAUD|nr:hypothetical protein HOV08_gp086 [Vibrio phage VspSw_1]QAY02158.1 hypothetical protein VspSw1_86 [Vibrio phage VspSw_1]